MYTVHKLKIGKTEQMECLARAAGELYSRVLTNFWRVVRKKGIWLKPGSVIRWQTSKKLHGHSGDAVVDTFFRGMKGWYKRKKTDPKAKPPYRRQYYFKVQWKSDGIRLRCGKLILSNGRRNAPLIIDWKWGLPKVVEMGWDGEQYEIRACYKLTEVEPRSEGEIVGVDLGEIHLAVAHDGKETVILNGRELRSKRRYQNKLKGKLASIIDVKKKGSRRRKGLIKSKNKQLVRLRNQIRDILHKQTTKLVSAFERMNVQTVIIGDIRNIRKNLDYGKKANQKIHQMLSGQTRHMLTYKSQRLGMQVELQDERYTSQTCPACNKRHKPSGREYKCSCGFHYHRDGVGAINIRRKYLGEFATPVVGLMMRPTGIRYRRSSGENSNVA